MPTSQPIVPSADAAAAAEFALRVAPRTPPTRVLGPATLAASLLVHASMLAVLVFALRERTAPVEPTIEFEVGVTAESDEFAAGVHVARSRDLNAVEEIHPESVPGVIPSPLPALTASGGAALGDRRSADGARGGPAIGGAAGSSVERGLPAGRELAAGSAGGCLWGVGAGQAAASYVYVLDRSGSMQDTFHVLRRELLRAIGSLHSEQRFNVIWFSDGPAESLAPDLIPATAENKGRASEAIGRIVPRGRTQPTEALRRGLSLRPDVLYLLSDGDFGERNEDVLEEVTRARRAAPGTIVNTILFAPDEVADGALVLRRIAERCGGTYKLVTQDGAGR